MTSSREDVTRLLQAISDGDSTASESLFPVVYEELHRLASNYMSRERANHTLQPTALIHEAFLRLTKTESSSETMPDVSEKNSADYRDLNHFIATAAVVMRRILVNHAKSKKTQKRGGNQTSFQLDDVAEAFGESAIDLIGLDEALKKLAEVDEIQHRLVELRFFGGLTTEQCAKLLGISERAAYYEWAHARAWLKCEIEGE